MRDMIYDEVVGFVPVEDVVENIDVKFDTCIGANVVTWHPYPAEKPVVGSCDMYLVSLSKDYRGMIVMTSAYSGGKWYLWDADSEMVDGTEDVVAWAELPRPYEG